MKLQPQWNVQHQKPQWNAFSTAVFQIFSYFLNKVSICVSDECHFTKNEVFHLESLH